MRDILAVTAQILNEVPKDQRFHTLLTEFLLYMTRDIGYTPPENMIDWWDKLSIKMNQMKPPGALTEEWEFKAISIFTEKSVDEVKRLFGKKKETPVPSTEPLVVTQTHFTYFSERNMSLLWTDKSDVHVITAENYEKWYSLYIVYPNGEVEKVPSDVVLECNDQSKHELLIDHYFHPHLLLLVAKYYGGVAHTTALEVAAGRWAMNGLSRAVEMEYYIDED